MTWRLNNSTLLGGEVCAPWQTNHAYSLGARCVCRIAYGTAAARAFVYEVTTAGTSHATTEPVWPLVVGNTVVDNGVTWTCRSPDDGNWDNATCLMHYLLNHAAVAAGDVIYVDDGHSESIYTSAITIKGATGYTNPIKIFCVDKAADTLSTGAIVQPLSGQTMTFVGFGYSYGVKYKVVNANFGLYSTTVSAHWMLEGSGTTELLDLANSAGYLRVGHSSYGYLSRLDIRKGSIRLGYNSMYFWIDPAGYLSWFGGTLFTAAGLNSLISAGSGKVIIADVDLDDVGQGASAARLVSVTTLTVANILFARCKLPSDAGFLPIGGTWGKSGSGKIKLHHCSADNKTYDFHEEAYEGSIVDETGVVRDGGASDGTNPQSWKMASSANVVDRYSALESPPIIGWTSSVVSKTFAIECIVDSAVNLQDDEVWAELEYPANNTDGLGAVAVDRCAMLAAPADQAASTEAWNGTGGMANPNRFKLSVTVTPGKVGPITARVFLAKPSTTIYVDPMVKES